MCHGLLGCVLRDGSRPALFSKEVSSLIPDVTGPCHLLALLANLLTVVYHLQMNSRYRIICRNLGRLTKGNSISPLTDYNYLYRGSRRVNQNPFTHQTCRVSSSSTLRSGQSRLPSNFLSTLQSRHPDLKVSTNTYDLDAHGHGESYHPSSPPDAVIYPSSVEEIQDILSLCCRESAEQNDNQEVVSLITELLLFFLGANIC